MGASTLWHHRRQLFCRLALAAAILASIAWAFVILGWSPTWYPALRYVILVVGIAAAVGIALVPKARGVLAAGIAGLGIASIIAAPAAYSLNTAATPHSGAIPSAGPAIRSGGGFGGPGGFGNFARNGLTLPKGFTLPNGARLPNGITIPPSFFRHRFGGGTGGFGGGGGAGGGGFAGGPQAGPGGPGFPGAPGAPGGAGGGPAGGGGGLLNAATPGKQLTELLSAGASRYSWVAAVTGANSAAGYQLATDDPVMAIGGFNGTDPTPTLAQFEKYVDQGKIHYYIGGGAGRGGFGGFGGGVGGGFGGAGSPGASPASQIESWVSTHFSAQTVDGVTVYDLTAPASSNGG
jgi:hypothetical protein